MKMGYTKSEALKIVVSCAEKYHAELEGKSLLFITMDKYKRTESIEFSFHGYNYLHLTGLKLNRSSGDPSLTADAFYDRCLSHKLSPSDFQFSSDGSTALKLDVLQYVINKNLAANMIGELGSQKPLLYTEKLAGSVRACVGFVYDADISQYIPNTVLKEDIRDISKNTRRVIAVFRKRTGDKEYAEITYLARKVDWSAIRFPDAYANLLDICSKAIT